VALEKQFKHSIWEKIMNSSIEKYIILLKKKNMSKNTIDAYKRDIVRFESFTLKKHSNLAAVNQLDLREYVQNLQKNNLASSSIVRNIVSLRRFYGYLKNSGTIIDNPILEYESPKIKRTIPQILTVEEVDKLLNIPDTSINKGIRDKAMLEVMYAAGLKVTELINLKVSDVNLKLSYIKCTGSSKRERIIPIGTYAINRLQRYFEIRPEINKKYLGYLFLNLKGEALSRQGFWKIIKGYASLAGIQKRIDSNTLRNSFAVHLLQNGADIKTVQELLGHRELSATLFYSTVTKKSRIAEVYKKFHPRA